MDETQPTTSRRQALRAGAVIAGAAWVAPALTLVGVGPAHADSASGGGHTPPPHTPPTVEPTKATSTTSKPTVSGTKATNDPTVSGIKFSSPPGESSALSALPRTGGEIATAAAVGAGLLATGVALRRVPGASARGSHRRGPDDDHHGED